MINYTGRFMNCGSSPALLQTILAAHLYLWEARVGGVLTVDPVESFNIADTVIVLLIFFVKILFGELKIFPKDPSTHENMFAFISARDDAE